MKVRFKGPLSDTVSEIGGPVMLLPAGLRVAGSSAEELTIEPDVDLNQPKAAETPDVYVGQIPIIYRAPDGNPALRMFEVAPPPPFRPSHIESMWAEIVETGCPVPAGIALQGRHAWGTAGARRDNLTLELLTVAYHRCRGLLARWPTEPTIGVYWRDVELRGGKEDFVYTERAMARSPAGITSMGTYLPQRTARRRGVSERWRCRRLHWAATVVAKELSRIESGRFGGASLDPISTVIRATATEALPADRTIDGPISTWPTAGRLAYEGLLAALSSINANDSGSVRAPLSHLWRLYEAWCAVTCFTIIKGRLGEPTEPPHYEAGTEWVSRWRLTDGTVVCVYAHPTIGKEAPSTTLRLVSVSSELVPDGLVCIERGGEVDALVVDAKRRLQTTAMKAADVAEAASKYVWGIRLVGGGEGHLPVSKALIASSMPTGSMYSEASRIGGLPCLPLSTHLLMDAITAWLERHASWR